MKKILTIALCLISFQAFAQTNNEAVSDTTEITVGKKTIRIINSDDEKNKVIIDSDSDGKRVVVDEDGKVRKEHKHRKKSKVDTDFFALDFGLPFFTIENDFNLPSQYSQLEIQPVKSFNFGLNFLNTKFSLIKNHVNLMTALTFDINRYHWANDVSLVPNVDTLTMINDSVSFKKNFLGANYLQIPLMLGFETNPHNKKKNFHFAVGGYAGLLIGSFTKQKSEEKGKVRFSDDYNLNKIRYGVTGRIGFAGLDLYCNYNLNTLFREDQGPAIQPITFGIRLTGFN